VSIVQQFPHIRLRDFQLPIYDGDMEAAHGLPQQALELKELLAQHHALLIATPEYNGGYSGLLKNALDWMSRPTQGGPSGLQGFSGMFAALVSASPEALGGLRSQIVLQMTLSKLGLSVIPDAFALSRAHEAFDERGQLKDPTADQLARGVGAALVRRASTSTNGFRRASHDGIHPGESPTRAVN
jgi:chromate reductase, NAD(P)H dehydrogenase (quinone)